MTAPDDAGSTGPGGAPTDPVRSSARRSMWRTLGLWGLGVAAALTGAGVPWAQVIGVITVEQLGSAPLTTATVTGDDLVAFSPLTLLALALVAALVATRGRGRWPVGVLTGALGLLLVVQAVQAGVGTRAATADLVVRGQLPGVPASAVTDIVLAPLGPTLVVLGGLLIAVAGVLTVARGRSWPALGDAYRAPGDRPDVDA